MKTLILFMLLLSAGVTAQVYPVQVTPQLTPPYSPYLSDYTAPGSRNFLIQIRANDISLSDYPCKLRVTIEGPGITLRTSQHFLPPPIYLQGGTSQTLYGEDIRDYLHPTNLDLSGLPGTEYGKTARLPDGIYRFSVEVLDYNRGTVVSNKGMTSAWILLNDPPILNLPSNFSKVKIQDPLNIMFSWTPRHTGSPNAAFTTEYTFRLVELWPASRNPGDALLTQTPLYETTTSQSQILFGPSQPQLLPGKKYAWQVQARDLDGKDLFKNRGRSEIFVFQYGEALPVPQDLRMRWAKPTTLAIQWDPVRHFDGEIRYRLQYRPRLRRENHEWYETWTRFTDKTLYHLESNTEYEMRIRSENALQESEYSTAQVFKTLAADASVFVCRETTSALPLPDNTFPVFPLSINDTIRAGGYNVLVRDVMKVGNKYHGAGLAIVPWFNGAKVRVTFENIAVNDGFWLTSGTIRSVWKAESSFLHEEQSPLDPGTVPEAGHLDITVVSTDSLITVEATAIAAISTDENGNAIVTTTDGTTQVLTKGESYAVVDRVGNGYVIDEKGNIAKTTSTEAEATATRGNRTYSLAVHFDGGDGLFGFDARKFEALSSYYQQLDDGTYVAWKALSSSRPDEMIAIHESDNVDRKDIAFLAASAPVVPVSYDGKKIRLSLQGKSAGMEEELLALHRVSDTIPPKIVGKLNLATYDPIRYDLEIVPVNGASLPGGLDAASISRDLNAVYRQAIVEWNVYVKPSLDVPLDDTFDEGETGLFSHYTADMKKVLRAFGPLRANTYYLFVVQTPLNPATLGYMPRNKQAGFLFSGPHGGNASEFLKTIAHELGHGAFNLQHTFKEHNLPAGMTDNVMDYSDGKALYKYQWDYIHEPQRVIPLFETGEEGAILKNGLASFYDQGAPLLDAPEYKEWAEKIKKVYEFFQSCDDEGWESYNGRGIIPYCFWRDQEVPTYNYYSNEDLPFTAGLIDGGYTELVGLYRLPDAIRDITKFPGKVVYAYTLAYWECSTEKLMASADEYEYVIGHLAEMEKERGLWNWVKEQWYDYKEDKEDIEKYFQDCRNADDLREAVEDLYDLVSNWEEIKKVSVKVYNALSVYWGTLQESDNHGRYERGALIVPATSLILPISLGLSTKAEKLKTALRIINEASTESVQKIASRISELLVRGRKQHSDGIATAGKIAHNPGDETGALKPNVVEDSELRALAASVKFLPGPILPSKIANTFTNSLYKNRKLVNSERFLKYHGENNRTGRKYTWVVRKRYSSEIELRTGLAIRNDFGVDIKYVSEFEVPKGTWVSEGTAASQGIGYPGGDYQAVFLNIPRAWIIKTNNAFVE